MCGRYQFNSKNNPYIDNLLNEAKKVFSKKSIESLAKDEVFPSQNALVAISDEKTNKEKFTIMRWGYSFSNKKLLINTRKDKIETPFYESWKPCVIPASSYYEWSKDKVKYRFSIENQAIFFAGLYKDNCFTIITEEASGAQRDIHHRQPVILNYTNAKLWCKRKELLILSNSLQVRNIETS